MLPSQRVLAGCVSTERARSEEFGGDVCVVAWVVEDGDVVVLDVNHRF